MASNAEFLTMKSRAERAEARVRVLEAEVASLKAGKKFAEPMSKLVQVAPNQWKYEEEK